MRALTIDEHGGLDRLRVRDDLPAPAIDAPGDVRVRVHAASLNHLDLFVVGGLPGLTITPPWILGSDAVGVVDAVGPAVTSVATGTRVALNPGVGCGTCEYCRAGEAPLCLRFAVLGEHRPGSFAEYVVVPATHVREVPASIPDDVAAAFPLAGLTAWRMVVSKARVGPDDLVLVQGIGSAVSIAALQIARLRGAEVWVTSSSDDKLARARELGASQTINYRTQDVAKEVRSRTGKRGVDVVIDSAGRDSWPASLGALGRRGRLVACGGTTGPIVEVDVRRLFWNQWTLMGSTMSSEAEFAAVMDEFVAGRLTMPVDSVFPLEQGRQAFERLASGRQFGKVVLEVRGGREG
ncbi:MAG: zinc-binding dehydrogenase [Gemmatimonadota bacterium]|nr:zinc-binding dehydrogenase [Gemmatimonadota bacterium]